MLANGNACIPMKGLKDDCHTIACRLSGCGVGVYICQAWDKKGPADQSKKLNGTGQDAHCCANHEIPRGVWLEYLLHYNWDGGKEHCRERKGIPKVTQWRATFLETPQDVIGWLAQDVGILKCSL